MKDNLIVRFAILQNLLRTACLFYLSSDVLLQLHPARRKILQKKSSGKAVSFRFHFTFSSHMTPWLPSPCPCFDLTLPKQCSLPLIVVENCHHGGKNSHPAGWSKLHLWQYRSEEEEATVTF